MKQKLVFTILTVMLLTFTACGDNESNGQPSAAGNTTESSPQQITVETEIPYEGNENISRRIEPLPATLNIAALDNCTAPASFHAEDVISQEEVLSIHMTVYDYELFDLVDISLMSTGDTLVIDGEEILVESIDRNEPALVAINGGFEEGGRDLYTEETGVYYEVIMDIGKNYYALGEITLPLAADFVYTDDSDPENQGKEYDMQGFLTELETNESSFNQSNTRITIQNGYVTDIHRIYAP